MSKKITLRIIYECQYEGDCFYKNPENKHKCNGCKFSKLNSVGVDKVEGVFPLKQKVESNGR